MPFAGNNAVPSANPHPGTPGTKTHHQNEVIKGAGRTKDTNMHHKISLSEGQGVQHMQNNITKMSLSEGRGGTEENSCSYEAMRKETIGNCLREIFRMPANFICLGHGGRRCNEPAGDSSVHQSESWFAQPLEVVLLLLLIL